MPSSATMFRVVLFFILLSGQFVLIVFILSWIFGVKLDYWVRYQDWKKRKESEKYEIKLKNEKEKNNANRAKK